MSAKHVALKRWTVTDKRWKKNVVSRGSVTLVVKQRVCECLVSLRPLSVGCFQSVHILRSLVVASDVAYRLV